MRMPLRSPAIRWFLALAAVLFTMVALTRPHFSRNYRVGVKDAAYRAPVAIDGWVRFDAGWYRHIADQGYYYRGDEEQSAVAFFPSYALAMRALSRTLPMSSAVAGVLITFVCGLAAAWCFERWCRQKVSPQAARYGPVLLLVSPYGFYLFGAVYAEALFLLAAVGACLLIERDRPVLAGLVGAIGSAARPIGIGLAVGLLAVQLQRSRQRGYRRSDWAIGLALAGFGTYCVFLWIRFGNPLAFAKAEGAPGWDNTSSPRTWFKVEYFDRIFSWPHGGPEYTSGIILHSFIGLLALALAVAVRRRAGWGYAVYVAGVLIIPLIGSKDFHAMGRYALAAFPSFAVAGEWLAKRPRMAQVGLGLSALLMGFLCNAYARGSYVA